MGQRDFLPKTNIFFTSSGAQRWAEREMGNKKYGHPYIKFDISEFI